MNYRTDADVLVELIERLISAKLSQDIFGLEEDQKEVEIAKEALSKFIHNNVAQKP